MLGAWRASQGSEVAYRHRTQSVARMVMSQPSCASRLCSRGCFAATSSCAGTHRGSSLCGHQGHRTYGPGKGKTGAWLWRTCAHSRAAGRRASKERISTWAPTRLCA